MTVTNFNWSMHALLFLHTQRVIRSQEKKKAKKDMEIAEQDEQDEDSDEVGIDIEREV